MEKIRLDIALVEQGLATSREKAKAYVMAGNVFVDDVRVDKPGEWISKENRLEIRGEKLKYVSRGGLKLEKAMQCFPIQLKGKTCMDIGASTGGFTDCMLQNGAQKVYAIDVGYGQLAWSLRTDERVVNLERHNIRYITQNEIPEPIDFASVDVSFISLTLVLPVLYERLRQGGEAVCLIKPQFEIGKGRVGKKGVVRDPNDHVEVIQKIYSFSQELGFSPQGLTFSPVKGPEGNIEYLLYVRKSAEEETVYSQEVEELVFSSHQALDVYKRQILFYFPVE